MPFCTIKFGANEERLINPNVMNAVLLSHLKRVCFEGNSHGPAPDHLDLATETGEVVDLHGKPKEYARKYLEGRGSYILVKAVGEESDDMVYVPLLDQIGDKIKFGLTNPTKQQKAAAAATGPIGKSKGAASKEKQASPRGSLEDLGTSGRKKVVAGSTASNTANTVQTNKGLNVAAAGLSGGGGGIGSGGSPVSASLAGPSPSSAMTAGVSAKKK
ncbi:hypothetical protein BC830DRAFT_171104 [Chytriomyces sp. MP71]|nr:hypothetical protein BC830DRAFT_171104 [Chytriomyces sp. MP71]